MPERTCCVCRKKAPADALIRLVLLLDVSQDGSDSGSEDLAKVKAKSVQRQKQSCTVQLDILRKRPGRGVYVHPRAECCLSARFSEQLSKSLRGRYQVKAAPFLQLLAEAENTELKKGEEHSTDGPALERIGVLRAKLEPDLISGSTRSGGGGAGRKIRL